MNTDISVIKDNYKKLKIKNELMMNEYIRNIVKENTQMNHRRSHIKQQEETNEELINSLTTNNCKTIFFGIVESTFIDEVNQERVKEIGSAVLIDPQIALVPARNLVFDNQTNKETNEQKNYELYDIELRLINIDNETKAYLPNTIKVIDYYTPLDEDKNYPSDEDIFKDGWGLIVLEYPVENFLQIKSANSKENIIKSSMSSFKLKYIDNSELTNYDIKYYDCIPIVNGDEESIVGYVTIENAYDLNLNEDFFYLKGDESINIIPGFIIASICNRSYLIGLTTNILVEVNDNETETVSLRMAIRFNKELSQEIYSKVCELKANIKESQITFSSKLFNIFNSLIDNKEQYMKLFKDNSKGLYSICNEIKANKRYMLTEEEKEMLTNDLTNDKTSNFIKLAFTLMWNKHFNSPSVEFENMNIGLSLGLDVIADIIKTRDSLINLNLRDNLIFSKGLKKLIKPIFNTKRILFIGKDLQSINLDGNKLTSKGMKYLRHLLKASPMLKKLSLDSNYIRDDGLKYLVNSFRDKEEFYELNLSFNMLGSKSGRYLNKIISHVHKSIASLDIQSNCLTDDFLGEFSDSLKSCAHLKFLNLSNCKLTSKCSNSLYDIITNCNSLNALYLSNNNLADQGVVKISSAFTKDIALQELILNNVECGDEAIVGLCNNIKPTSKLKRLLLNSNNIGDASMNKLGELLSLQSESSSGIEILSLCSNNITDDGAKFLVEPIMTNNNLKQIKLSSNKIGDEAGEMLLYSALYNTSIKCFHIENNLISWRENNLNIKNLRKDFSVFF